MNKERLIKLRNTFKSARELVERLDLILRQIDLTHQLSPEEQELLRTLRKEEEYFWQAYREARGDFDEN